VLLLLDTHVLVWTLEGDARRVGRRTRALLARAEAGDAIRVSPVSLFELTALHTLGRIRFTRPLDDWLDGVLAGGRVRMTELTRGMAIDAGGIPPEALADPLDRLLAATARALEATLLTSDQRILKYASTIGTLRVHDAKR
jgi:PIN domain nuclease of toxin-antitoxin system